MRVIGLDPGLRHTGWGVLDVDGPRLSFVDCGIVHSAVGAALSKRLADLFRGIEAVLGRHRPDEAAIEETFVNRNPTSTLKLGLARGAIMLAPALAGLTVAEYAPNRIKKAVVGVGHASKAQVEHMVATLLPDAGAMKKDAADAVAVAICHAHYAVHRRLTAELPGRETVALVEKARPRRRAPADAAKAESLARSVFELG